MDNLQTGTLAVSVLGDDIHNARHISRNYGVSFLQHSELFRTSMLAGGRISDGIQCSTAADECEQMGSSAVFQQSRNHRIIFDSRSHDAFLRQRKKFGNGGAAYDIAGKVIANRMGKTAVEFHNFYDIAFDNLDFSTNPRLLHISGD